MKAMIRDAYCPTIAVRGTEAGHFREQGEPRGSDRSGGAHRIREGPPLLSTVPTRSPRSPRPSGIWKKDTREEKSSSLCEANSKGLFTEVPSWSVLRRSFAASRMSRVHQAGLYTLPPV